MQVLDALAAQGQSLWLDYIRRSLIRGGDLARLTAEGVRGLTSNPSIFEDAIGGSDDYDEALQALLDNHSSAVTRRCWLGIAGSCECSSGAT